MQEFRPINEKESRLSHEAFRRSGMPRPIDLSQPLQALVAYFTDDEELFTQCVIRWNSDSGHFISVGSTKRMTYANQADSHDEEIAHNISFSRAVKAALHDNLVRVD